jgi:hypothetical protein
VLEYRLTKYDPAFRDAGGAYLRDEWTSIGDIGRSFGGRLLTADDYARVEDAYVAAALSFWREVGSPRLTARAVERASGRLVLVEAGAVEQEAHLAELTRALLREEIWCRLESETYFLHVGFDFYAYVGVSAPCTASCALAAASGLFVEPFTSPHHPSSA